jgi:hypothetical protein
MAEPMIKGAVLREFVHWYETHHGIERLRTLAQNLPDDLRSYIDPDEPIVNLLAASWYPSRLGSLLLDRLSEGLSQAEIERMAHDANRWIVKWKRTASVARGASECVTLLEWKGA